jgi:hypothetical protein
VDMRKPSKKYVTLCDEVCVELDGSFDEVIEELGSLKTQYEGCKNVRFCWGTTPDGYFETYVYYSRLETDKEHNKRIKELEKTKKQEASAKKEKEAVEREEYERLKKKYG